MPPERDPASILLDDPEWEAQSIPTGEVEEPEPEESEEQEEGEEVPAGPGDDDEETGEDEQEEEGSDDEEDEEAGEGDEVAADDPEIKAFLAKYGNDPEKALKGAAELSRLIGRQGRDLTKAQEQIAQLQSMLVEAQTVGAGMGLPLNEQQREWVEQASQSVNPAAYVQQAVREGAFDLGRALCREWALSNPYEALRVGQWVDATEAQMFQAAQEVPQVTTDQVIAALDDAMPEMRAYYGRMTEIVKQLGEGHPVVIASRSSDPEEAMSGMIDLYRMAQVSTAAVQGAQSELKKRKRQEADDERAKGLVSSGSNSPSREETPRNRLLMPGLTQQALDTEFAAQAGR